ncbi:MAG TPA: tRNA glutamyl-Q(34) synthetase GluQRS [Burkholderiales bacterium]|nr:tRNA glutamyl-Q(34) synthetase GluQRS [Burkholderiales bacterium]
MAQYRGRFAPSPTGPLHFGSLVAALGSFLEARSRGGQWLLRIEDLDAPRVAPGAAADILSTLAACGLEWDGAVAFQSARREAYHAALHRLREQGLLYPCACSRREVADSAFDGPQGPVYPGTCRAGARNGLRARSLRLVTRGTRVAFQDALQGAVAQDLEREVGDFVLYRAHGGFAYQLAVVVDDAAQGVTDVVRGADLLASTPRQIYLQRLLGLPQPRYAHLPVAVNARGEKLSKQTLAAPVPAARPAPALVAALAFLGQRPPAALARAPVGEIRAWALANWSLARVPRALTAPAAETAGEA